MASITIKNISKNFQNKNVLQNIDLNINEGEMISLLGPSGCGKTTMLKVIAGLIKPDNGDIFFNGNSVLNISVEKRGAIIVFQEYRLFPHLTVEKNIEFGLKMAKVSKDKRKRKIKEMIDLVKLNGHEKKYPRELSGGQQQRVAVARSLAIEPKVLLLDEPFSNLDTRLRESMREFVSEIQKKLGITTILVTHDKEEALTMSNKIAVMLNGEIRQYGTPQEIYENPSSKSVADFFGEKNYVDGEISDGYFKCSFGKFKTKLNINNKVKAMVRPEEIEILNNKEEKSINGIIKSRKYAGDKIFYTIRSNDKDIKCICSPKRIFDIGEKISFVINFDNIVYFPIEA